MTLRTLILTLTDPQGAFESFCVPVFCDFARNYSCTVNVAIIVTSFIIITVVVVITTQEICPVTLSY